MLKNGRASIPITMISNELKKEVDDMYLDKTASFMIEAVNCDYCT